MPGLEQGISVVGSSSSFFLSVMGVNNGRLFV